MDSLTLVFLVFIAIAVVIAALVLTDEGLKPRSSSRK